MLYFIHGPPVFSILGGYVTVDEVKDSWTQWFRSTGKQDRRKALVVCDMQARQLFSPRPIPASFPVLAPAYLWCLGCSNVAW